MISWANIIVVVASLITGWVALVPIRRLLGVWGYHLFALPVGLLAWPTGVVIAFLTGQRFGVAIALAGCIVLAAVVAATGVLLVGRERLEAGSPVPWWSWLAGGGVVAATAVIAGLMGLASGAYDSIFHYQSWGVWIADTGRLTPEIMGAYSPFLPSLHAAVLAFQGDWAFVIYPVMSANLAALLAWMLWRTLPPALGPRVRTALVAGTLLLLVSLPYYVHHTFYAHSHMASALFLFASISGVREAYFGAGSRDAASGTAWALVAGIAGASFALVRTDGLAYVVVILMAVAVLEACGEGGWKRLVAVYTGLLGPLAAVYGAAIVGLGLWESNKLNGIRAGVMIVALFILAGGIAVVMPWVRRWLSERRALLGALVAANALLVIALWSVFPRGFYPSVANMVGNLSYAGGYGFTWYFALGLLAIAVSMGRAWENDAWSDVLLYAIGQFFFIALVVHGVAHEGRLNPADSFNRLVFHVLPLVFWLGGLIAGGLVATFRRKEIAR